jgi:hypothetical protein
VTVDFEAKARGVLLELLGTFSDATDRDSLCFIADALRAAALDEGAREAARADLARLLAEVRAAEEHPPFTVESWDDPEPFAAADAAPILNAILRNPDARLITLLERLCWLLGLSDGERRFVAALAEDAGDFDGLQVFSDWLEDQGRTAGGARLRRLVPKDGDVLVWTVPPAVDAWDAEPFRNAAARIREKLRRRGVATEWVVLPNDTDLSSVSPEAMRAAGWVRAADVRRALRDVADDAVTMPGGVDAAVQTALDLFPPQGDAP